MKESERCRQDLSAIGIQKDDIAHENITPEKYFHSKKIRPCIGLQPCVYLARRNLIL